MFIIQHRGIPQWVPVILGLLLGVATGIMWCMGLFTSVRAMLPYAFGAAVLLLIESSVLRARCGDEREGYCISPTCFSVSRFSKLVIIPAAIFTAVALLIFAASLTMTLVVKTVLAFVGAISFWLMLCSFLAKILSIIYYR